MPAELGVTKFGNDCASLEDMRQQLVMLDDALGNPTVPTGPGVPTVENVYYNNDDGTLVTPDGSVITGTGAVLAELPLYMDGDTVKLKYDNSTITLNGSDQLQAAAAMTYTFLVPLVESGGEVDIDYGDGTWKDGSDQLAVRLADNSGLEFDGNTPGRLRDKWRYHVVKGKATANYHPGTGDTIIIDNVEAIRGESPVATLSDTITCNTEQDIWLDDNETVYAVYVENPADTVTTNWTVATGMNLAALLKGFADYDPSETQDLKNTSGTIAWGPAGTTIYTGDLKDNVPAGEWVADCVDILDFVPGPTDNDYTVNRTIGAMNRTRQNLRGSVGVPTPVWGKIITAIAYTDETETTTEEVELLEIIWCPLYGLPGHDTDVAQAPYHPAASDSFTLDGGPCPTGA